MYLNSKSPKSLLYYVYMENSQTYLPIAASFQFKDCTYILMYVSLAYMYILFCYVKEH